MSVVSRIPPAHALGALSLGTLRGLGMATAAAGLTLAGCSANIARFDNPSFALGESAGGTLSRRTAGGPLEPPAPSEAAPSRPQGTQVAGLTGFDEQAGAAPGAAAASSSRAMAVTRAPAPLPQAPTPAPVARSQQQIEVRPGDTLYALARRHNVLISDLMAANQLANPNLKPGQKLWLPASAGVRPTPQVRPDGTGIAKAAPQPAPVVSAPAPVAQGPAPTAGPAMAESATSGTYTVRQGDSLYAIAARHKVKLLDLQRVNDISDARKVKPGMVLRLPGAGDLPSRVASGPTGETIQPETRIVRSAPSTVQPMPGPAGVRMLNGGDAPSRVASVEPSATTTDVAPIAAAPTAPAATGKLRWPVKGRILQGFGPRADGTHNDGVDIAVPAGTDVLAAESGVVAYAGNEVRTYGNLVLIRHDNGWVTAYAYNDKLLVQRGDRVKRGQPIAKAGKTGAADQPQVHFEVRVGAKPVDPTGYLERM
jgi:murein DD-endopeptidase MepM/ murein hydrolase activator NlpD